MDGPAAPEPKPGEPPTPTGSMTLDLGNGKPVTLNQTLSADGARYATKDESLVFWNKGRGALVLQNGKEKDYTNCKIALE